MHVQDDVAVPRERRLQPASERNDLDGKALERGQQIQQFLGFAGITQRQDDIAVVDDAEIAMQGVHAAEHDAGRAGAGEGGGDFRADIAGLADADNDQFAPTRQGIDDQFDSGIKGLVELRADLAECGNFDVEHFAGFGQMTHRARMRRSAAGFNHEPCNALDDAAGGPYYRAS